MKLNKALKPSRKRYSGIRPSDEALTRLVRALEIEDAGLEDPDAALPLLRGYHAALVDLLVSGPLRCDDAIARERELTDQPTLSPADVSVVRAELLQLLRSAVRGDPAWTRHIGTRDAVMFETQVDAGHVVLVARGSTEDLIVLQAVLLLQEVGIHNLRECAAPDCRSLYVKVYRREFCSERCQKRINRRKQLQQQRERRARQAERRQRRRKGV